MSGREHRSASGGTRPVPAGRDPSGADRHPTSPPAPGAALVTGTGGDLPAGAISASGPGWAPVAPAARVATLRRLVDQHGAGGWCPACDEWECLPGVLARQGLVSLLVEGGG